jgi:TonB-dependent SusC/RagA subfamily outer membrane receptor
MKKILLAICLFASVGAMAQNSPKISQPAAVSGNTFGKPLVLLDGEKYYGDINQLDSKSVASITVLKNKDAIQRYGEQAANGVIIITSRAAAAKADSIAVKDSLAVKNKPNPSLTSAEPVYIIDGEKADSIKFKVLNPKDIDKIEIIKDANVTALYGPQGSNGIIKVTTKAGVKKATQKTKN